MKNILLASVCLLSFNFAFAAKNAKPAAPAKPAAEVKKEIDTETSTVTWLGKKKLVGDKHTGKIKIKEGTVIFDDKGQPQTAELVIDMATITNEDLTDKKMNAKLVGHLSNADFFDVKKYPTATLTVKSFAKDIVDKKDPKKNAYTYKATGDLKIKEKVQPVAFNVEVLPVVVADKKPASAVAPMYKAKGQLVIDRALWEIKYGSDSFFKNLGDKVIANDIEYTFDLATKN